MAAARDDANPIPWIIGVMVVLCCGGPFFVWWRIGADRDARAEIRPVVVSFLDAWRDGDAEAAGKLSCAGSRPQTMRRVREIDVTAYELVTVDSKSGKYGTRHYAEAKVSYAEGYDATVTLHMENEGGWKVCVF
jgi:hypothetical protein